MSKRPFKAPRRAAAPRAPRRNIAQKIENPVVEKISVKLLRLYLFSAYAFISLVIFYFSYSSYDSYMNRKHLEMEAAAYEIETNFANTLGYAESVLSHINRQILASKGTNEEIVGILSSFNRAHYGYSSKKDMLSAGMFYWVDANKMLTASSVGSITSPIDLSSRDYLENTARDPWRIYTGSPVVGAASGQYVIPAGVGVVDAQDRYVGTAVVSFKIYNLVEKFKRLVEYYKTDFAILDNSNKVLMESAPGLVSENVDLMNNLQLSNESLHQELISKFSPFQPKNSYVILHNLEKFPYKILVGYQNNSLTREVIIEMLPHLIEFLVISIFFATTWYLLMLAAKKHVRF